MAHLITDEDRRRLVMAHARRTLRTFLEADNDRLICTGAMGFLRHYHGGFWRAIVGEIVWHLRVVWNPVWPAILAWQHWARLTGRLRCYEGELHTVVCAGACRDLDDDGPGCVIEAAPRWIRRQLS